MQDEYNQLRNERDKWKAISDDESVRDRYRKQARQKYEQIVRTISIKFRRTGNSK